MQNVYIKAIAKFLPNEPISNDQMESVLGMVNGKPSRARSIVLRNNRIVQRFYAIDKQGNLTHNNTQLTLKAIQNLIEKTGISPEEIEILSCGTSTPDQMLPSHASMVHGAWQKTPLEVNSATGICTSGMNALKYGFMAIASGNAKNAVTTGSERVSSWLRAEKFNNEAEKLTELEQNPVIAFDKDFLRWMLSDGAGAILLSNEPNAEGISLKIKWIKGISYANELETCMYAGATKDENGNLISWSDSKPEEWLTNSIFSIKQDIKLLDANIIKKGVESIRQILGENGVKPEEIDHFLPHISSYFFHDKLNEAFIAEGIDIPLEKWFVNLETFGNIGSASIYLQLEQLFYSARLKKGEKILLSVPESGRFSYVYGLLEVV
ncbi:MAG TPA: beta-ketoacyl-ACP synthase III [Moheibacter sp.]|nr:beta-ketoacyl-ACP synthase III [Moheibacter sp.]